MVQCKALLQLRPRSHGNGIVPFHIVPLQKVECSGVAFGQVNNADPADPADLAILVRDIKVRVIQFDLGEIE